MYITAARLYRIYTGLPLLSLEREATRNFIINLCIKKAALANNANATVFLAPYLSGTQYGCSSVSIMADILAHAFRRSKNLPRLYSAFPGFPSDRIPPWISDSCTYSYGHSSGLSAGFPNHRTCPKRTVIVGDAMQHIWFFFVKLTTLWRKTKSHCAATFPENMRP